jgi:hypothetical protein
MHLTSYSRCSSCQTLLRKFENARRTLHGYEAMNILQRGQIRGAERRDSMKQVAFIADLFGVAI